jgi:hypothetical protein
MYLHTKFVINGILFFSHHTQFSEYYFHFCSLLFLLLLASASLIPASVEPFLASDNSTILISSYCAMQDVSIPIFSIFYFLPFFLFKGIWRCFLRHSIFYQKMVPFGCHCCPSPHWHPYLPPSTEAKRPFQMVRQQ